MSIQLTPLPADLFDEWRAATRRRLIALHQESGTRPGADAIAHADEFLAELLPAGPETSTAHILLIEDERGALGTIWLGVNAGRMFLVSLAVEPEIAASDELFEAVLAIARDNEVRRISAGVLSADRATQALIEGRGFTLASIRMVLEPLPERDADSSIQVSPMSAERFPVFVADSEAAFAQDLVDSDRYTPEEAAVESRRQMALELPDGLHTEGQRFFTASVDGVEVGILWIGMRERDGRPHAFVLDIEVAADQRRKGYGRALMHVAEREGKALGADSIGLHVFGFNSGAIDLYEQLGYRRIEEMHLLDL